MRNITTVTELKNAIQLMEAERIAGRLAVKEQFHLIYKHFNPANLIKGTLKDISSSSSLVDDIIVPAVGITAGYLSKKIVVGSSDNKYRQLIGSIVQSEVANVIIQHPDALKSFGQFIFNVLSAKKK
jgi:hypothetical protein